MDSYRRCPFDRPCRRVHRDGVAGLAAGLDGYASAAQG